MATFAAVWPQSQLRHPAKETQNTTQKAVSPCLLVSKLFLFFLPFSLLGFWSFGVCLVLPLLFLGLCLAWFQRVCTSHMCRPQGRYQTSRIQAEAFRRWFVLSEPYLLDSLTCFLASAAAAAAVVVAVDVCCRREVEVQPSSDKTMRLVVSLTWWIFLLQW